MKEFSIYKYEDTIKSPRDLNWPLVYILLCKNGGVYIGETNGIDGRISNHEKKDWGIKDRWIISHDKGNKSQAYFLESHLINYIYASIDEPGDNRFILNSKFQKDEMWGGNNFFERSVFTEELSDIWNELSNKLNFKGDIQYLSQTEAFRYSPFFKEMSDEQIKLLEVLKEEILNGENSFVRGDAGTGKTLLTISLSAMIAEVSNEIKIGLYSAKSKKWALFQRRFKNLSPILKNKIKIVKTLNKKELTGIDHLIIDEGQLLRKHFFDGARMPQHFKDGYESDLSFIQSLGIAYTIFYDPKQDVERYSINVDEEFIIGNNHTLRGQQRIKTSENYMEFLNNLFMKENTREVFNFEDYDIKSFNSPNELYDYVKEMNDKYDNKARIISSISTAKWNSREQKLTEKNYDFDFGKLHWNKSIYDWVENEDVSKVGSIYSVHGSDLEYAGLIFGDEIKLENNKISIDPKLYQRYKGGQVFKGNSEEEKYQKILNIYHVLLTRGSRGLGVYIPDLELRKHFEKLIDQRSNF